MVHISEQQISGPSLIEPPSTDERAEENLSQQARRDLREATGRRSQGRESDHEYFIVKDGYLSVT